MQNSTRCVVRDSQGQSAQPPASGSVQPIDPSTAFHHIEGSSQPYPRYFNTPNQAAVAQLIADLEDAEAGLVFASGMAAISTTLRAMLPSGSHAVFLQGLYGGSQHLIGQELAEWGVDYSLAEGSLASFERALQPNTRLIYVESPTNPLLGIVDLHALAALASDRGIAAVIDNTFASPINQRPIECGFDVVIHSGTKYLGGHSDLCCGAVATSQSLLAPIYAKAKLFGGSLNAMSVYLLDRSLKTLDVRVRRQTENASALAEYLNTHKGVRSVYYPGLATHPGHEIAKQQMSGFGGMLAFELVEGLSEISFLKALSVIRPALSLGGVDSSVCIPATTSHRDVPVEELAAAGITPRLIRFSVGVEAIDDLQGDLDGAITAAAKTAAIAT